jgi:arsenical pump membrane protein
MEVSVPPCSAAVFADWATWVLSPPVAESIRQAGSQAWPPFVLVAGLLMIGAVAEADGMFAALGSRAERLGGHPRLLLAALLGFEAVVTAILNLDTAVVFVTPILLHAARRRGCDERPFLYGALFMANGASLLLPGSNLTNLIVLAHSRASGAHFAKEMALPWLLVVGLTIALVGLAFPLKAAEGSDEAEPPLRLGIGVAATVGAAALVLALRNPALPVLAVGIVAVAARRTRPRLDARVLAGLFSLAVVLGTLARRWAWPGSFVGRLTGAEAAAVGAIASVLVNNLPAAALLSAKSPPHPLPLLIGLNLGPNLAFTGSLSAYLWYRAARSLGAKPSLRISSMLGVILVPITIAAAVAALVLVDPQAV